MAYISQLTMQTAEIHQAGQRGHSLSPGSGVLRRVVSTTALALLLLVLWLILHRYRGIDNDAQIYALQALLRFHPALGADLYFQYTSQDAYTVFSPLYASVIHMMDLPSATLLLTVLCISWFLVAAWMLARDLCGRDVAWLSVGALIILPGAYGGAGVFHFSDLFLTARLPAQAMVVTALVLHVRGWKRLSLSIAAGALFIHPLMALPGLLLLICLSLPLNTALLGAAGGLLTTLGMAFVAQRAPPAAPAMAVMDPAWLEVVRERSHFLFPNLWSMADWRLNIQPFVSLVITVLVVPDLRIRKLCVGAIIVGLTGLAVALIAGEVAPVAILVQGQAWRWVWIADFTGILLLAPTALQAWRDKKCGLLCSLLVVLGWTFSDVDGFTCVSIALLLWLVRPYITDRAAHHMRWAGYALGAVAAAWVGANCWSILTSASAGHEPPALNKLRSIARLDIPAVVLLGLLWHWLRIGRSLLWLTSTTVVLLASAVYLAPKSFDPFTQSGSPALAREFADWRTAIPPSSSVYLADKYDTGAFVWFALDRPSYLSPDQSAGVVFSRATALEIRRRSGVVLPLEKPYWKVHSNMQDSTKPADKTASDYRPLTAKSLVSVCSDPQLGFVIAKEQVGFDPLTHTHSGEWKDWNLYDCRRVRSLDAPS
jgi:hypothetical protein